MTFHKTADNEAVLRTNNCTNSEVSVIRGLHLTVITD